MLNEPTPLNAPFLRLDTASLRVLMITTEFPTPERPGGGAYIMRSLKALREAGIEVDLLPFISRANPVNHVQAYRVMRRMMREKSYDLVHAHFGHGALIACLQKQLPVVITYHGSDLTGIVGQNGKYTRKGKFQVSLSRFLSRFAEEVIVVSKRLGERLPRKDFHVIPLGIDLDSFQITDKKEARAKLGWRPETSIALFASLSLDNPVKRYSLAKASIEILAKEMDCELKTASGISPQEMPLYMSASDVLLLTSLHEGSPTVVKEALACDLPVVSTDVGDVRERLRGVFPSVICEEETPEAIANALRPLLQNPTRSNGRAIVSELDEPLVAQRILEVYRRSLETR